MCFCCWNAIVWCPKDNYYMVCHYEKNWCFTTSLAIQFFNYKRHLQLVVSPWMLMDRLHELQSCNSSYIQCNSLQLYQNNSFSTTMQIHYNCPHYDMLMSLVIVHSLKCDTWHYEKIDIKIIFFSNIDLRHSLWLLRWSKIVTCGTIKIIVAWHINYILE
jgi:hypothetical protein